MSGELDLSGEDPTGVNSPPPSSELAPRRRASPRHEARAGSPHFAAVVFSVGPCSPGGNARHRRPTRRRACHVFMPEAVRLAGSVVSLPVDPEVHRLLSYRDARSGQLRAHRLGELARESRSFFPHAARIARLRPRANTHVASGPLLRAARTDERVRARPGSVSGVDSRGAQNGLSRTYRGKSTWFSMWTCSSTSASSAASSLISVR